MFRMYVYTSMRVDDMKTQADIEKHLANPDNGYSELINYDDALERLKQMATSASELRDMTRIINDDKQVSVIVKDMRVVSNQEWSYLKSVTPIHVYSLTLTGIRRQFSGD